MGRSGGLDNPQGRRSAQVGGAASTPNNPYGANFPLQATNGAPTAMGQQVVSGGGYTGQAPVAQQAPQGQPGQQAQQGTAPVPAADGGGSVSAEELLPLLERVDDAPNMSPQERDQLMSDLTAFLPPQRQYNDASIPKALQYIVRAIPYTLREDQRTKDPQTGKRDKSAQEMKAELVEQIKNTVGEKRREQQMSQQQQNKSATFNWRVWREAQRVQQAERERVSDARCREVLLSSAPSYSPKELELLGEILRVACVRDADEGLVRLAAANGKKKKKTRGNPFRVLMGKVGKLLDHGVQKPDVVRYLRKQKIWNDETIEKAVKIVKDYNRKKRRESGDADETTDENITETTESTPIALARYNHREWRTAEKRSGDESREPFSQEPDYDKRSPIELFASLRWLQSLQKYGKNTPQGDGRKADDREGVASKVRAIKAALKRQGFHDDEMGDE